MMEARWFAGVKGRPSVVWRRDHAGVFLLMRYFFNIERGRHRLQDLEGGEFNSDVDALTEARLVAREIIGRELLAGKAVEWRSRLEVLRSDHAIIGSFSFLEALALPHGC
jgi:hypothetical protein